MTDRRRSTIVPAYFLDPSEWAELVADVTVAEVVVNANSGPGAARSPEWARRKLEAVAADIRVAYYVATGGIDPATGERHHGLKPVDDIVEEVARWRDFYGWLDADVFYDEVPAGAELRWLRQLNHAARFLPNGARTGGHAIYNPGADGVTRATMLKLPGSVWCRWEGPGWLYLAERPRARFLWARTLHLVHTVRAQDLAAVHAHARLRAGLHYVTTDGLDGNPWDEFQPQRP